MDREAGLVTAQREVQASDLGPTSLAAAERHPEVATLIQGAGSPYAPVVKSWLVRFEESVSALGLLLMLMQVCLEITLRNVFNTSFLWSEEVSRYLMIWSVYFGASAAISNGMHLRIDMVIDHVGPRVRRGLDVIAQLWVLAFSIGIAVAGYVVVRETFKLGMVSADSNLSIPLGYIELVIPITFALSAVHSLVCLLRLLRGSGGASPAARVGH